MPISLFDLCQKKAASRSVTLYHKIKVMNTTKNISLKHKLFDMIAKVLKIEVPKNIIEHSHEELERMLFKREKRDVLLTLKGL